MQGAERFPHQRFACFTRMQTKKSEKSSSEVKKSTPYKNVRPPKNSVPK
jgi:hypothetical protein